jgi:hypothetical protein
LWVSQTKKGQKPPRWEALVFLPVSCSFYGATLRQKRAPANASGSMRLIGTTHDPAGNYIALVRGTGLPRACLDEATIELGAVRCPGHDPLSRGRDPTRLHPSALAGRLWAYAPSPLPRASSRLASRLRLLLAFSPLIWTEEDTRRQEYTPKKGRLLCDINDTIGGWMIRRTAQCRHGAVLAAFAFLDESVSTSLASSITHTWVSLQDKPPTSGPVRFSIGDTA